VYGTGTPTSTKDVSKSYSPISHPKMEGAFDLLVKGYPQANDGVGTGGGVGAYLCSLGTNNDDDAASNTSIIASLKAPRKMHGSPAIYNRWKHVGLVAGGTGIAPLYQIAIMLLDDPSEYTTDVHLLFMNRAEEDILMKDRLDDLVVASGGRFRVTYSLTSETSTASGGGGALEEKSEEKMNDSDEFKYGRGSVDMVKNALPPPMGGDGTTMILVCGTDGFVDWWGGPVGRAPSKADGSKGPKIQGPVLGLLKDAGYDESEVFKY